MATTRGRRSGVAGTRARDDRSTISGLDARRAGRRGMSAPARVAFGGAAFDCVLLDASPFGARVRLRAFVELPGLVTLRLPGGECRIVFRVWQTGLHAGFETVGTAPLAFSAAG